MPRNSAAAFRLRPTSRPAKIRRRAFDGARDVTWPGHVPYFALSSGTTSRSKMLPVTIDAVRSNKRAARILIAIMARRGDANNILSKPFLYLGGSTNLKPQGKSLVGDASGIASRHIPFYLRRRHLPPSDIGSLTDWEEKIGRIIQRYLTSNIACLASLPSWAAVLFGKLLAAAEKAGLPQRTIGELWPKFTHYVSYGMALAPYRRLLDQFIGRAVHYIDTYSSSEAGMTAVQEDEDGPMTMIVDNGVFYEFIPADQAASENPARLHIGEIETGKDYSVVVSTNGGIWAYPLGDVVRFVSLTPPRMVFAGRTQLSLSAFGEHIDLNQMEMAITLASQETSAQVADYTVQPIFPGPGNPVGHHRWIVEFEKLPADPAAFMRAVDQHLREESDDYDVHRTKDYGILPPELVIVSRGTFYHWMKSRGALGGQHKVPRVAKSAEMAEELLAMSRSLAGQK